MKSKFENIAVENTQGLIDKSLLWEDWQKEELEQFHEQEIASRQYAEDQELMYKQNPRMNY